MTSWAVNAQESVAFEYSRAGMNAHLSVEADNPYRSSDHNPEIIGLTLLGADPAPTPGAAPTPASPPTRQPSTPAPSRAARPATASSRPSGAPTPASARQHLARTGASAEAAIGIGILLAAAGAATRAGARRVARGRRHP